MSLASSRLTRRSRAGDGDERKTSDNNGPTLTRTRTFYDDAEAAQISTSKFRITRFLPRDLHVSSAVTDVTPLSAQMSMVSSNCVLTNAPTTEPMCEQRSVS